MTDERKAARELAEERTRDCDGCLNQDENGGDGDCTHCEDFIPRAFLALDAELTALKDQTRWRSVEEELPEKEFNAMVVSTTGWEFAMCIPAQNTKAFVRRGGTEILFDQVIKYYIMPPRSAGASR